MYIYKCTYTNVLIIYKCAWLKMYIATNVHIYKIYVHSYKCAWLQVVLHKLRGK